MDVGGNGRLRFGDFEFDSLSVWGPSLAQSVSSLV